MSKFVNGGGMMPQPSAGVHYNFFRTFERCWVDLVIERWGASLRARLSFPMSVFELHPQSSRSSSIPIRFQPWPSAVNFLSSMQGLEMLPGFKTRRVREAQTFRFHPYGLYPMEEPCRRL